MRIKDHANQVSVREAIGSVLARLKQYARVPRNGLIIYAGTVITDENKEKRITLDFEPPKPVLRTMYRCDDKFHTEPLADMLEDNTKFGFIVVDGNGALFASLHGAAREVLHRLAVDLPKKHGRGGQSAVRFARLREGARHNYLRKVGELATQLFISADQANVAGIVLAGSADLKSELQTSDLFDPRLRAIVLRVVDVAYGFENGLNQAIELSIDVLAGVRYVHEKQIIGGFFREVSLDSLRYAHGVEDALRALEMGAVETLLVWEALPHIRMVVATPGGGAPAVHVVLPDETRDLKRLTDPASGAILAHEDEPLTEWIAANYRKFGCTVEFVSNKSHEGAQFCRGFGGIGGILRYKIDFAQLRRAEQGGAGEASSPREAAEAAAEAKVEAELQLTDADFM